MFLQWEHIWIWNSHIYNGSEPLGAESRFNAFVSLQNRYDISFKQKVYDTKGTLRQELVTEDV